MTLRFKALVISSILLLAFVMLGAQRLYLSSLLRNSEELTTEFAKQIATDLVSGRPINELSFRSFISTTPWVGYLVVSNYRTGYRSGVLNTASLPYSGPEFEEFRSTNGDNGTLARVTRPGQGFAGEYMHVIALAFVPEKGGSDRTPIGALKVGYVVPGFVPGLPPMGRGYSRMLILLSAVLGAAALGVLAWRGKAEAQPLPPPMPLPKPPAPKVAKGEPMHDLAWLEDDTGEMEPVEVDEKGRSWRVLFNGLDLAGWNKNGEWYVFQGEMTGQPWGSSIVTTRPLNDQDYVFQVTAKKVAGDDGFIVLFPYRGNRLTWVLGGWGNTRSQVAGFDSTKSDVTVEKGKWVSVEIRASAQEISGTFEGEKIWTLTTADVTTSSPDLGFLPGLGVAVWNTLVKFRDLRCSVLA